MPTQVIGCIIMAFEMPIEAMQRDVAASNRDGSLRAIGTTNTWVGMPSALLRDART